MSRKETRTRLEESRLWEKSPHLLALLVLGKCFRCLTFTQEELTPVEFDKPGLT